MDDNTAKTLDSAFFTVLDEVNQIIKINPDFQKYLLTFKCILNFINLKFQRTIPVSNNI